MRAIRLVINWFVVLTSPLWVLPVFIAGIIWLVKLEPKYRKAWVTGEILIGDEE